MSIKDAKDSPFSLVNFRERIFACLPKNRRVIILYFFSEFRLLNLWYIFFDTLPKLWLDSVKLRQVKATKSKIKRMFCAITGKGLPFEIILLYNEERKTVFQKILYRLKAWLYSIMLLLLNRIPWCSTRKTVTCWYVFYSEVKSQKFIIVYKTLVTKCVIVL